MWTRKETTKVLVFEMDVVLWMDQMVKDINDIAHSIPIHKKSIATSHMPYDHEKDITHNHRLDYYNKLDAQMCYFILVHSWAIIMVSLRNVIVTYNISKRQSHKDMICAHSGGANYITRNCGICSLYNYFSNTVIRMGG